LKCQGRLPSWRENEKRRKEKTTGKQEVELSNEVKVSQKAFYIIVGTGFSYQRLKNSSFLASTI
jgi:hypothetical protein